MRKEQGSLVKGMAWFCKLASSKGKGVNGKTWKPGQITSLQDCLGEECGGRKGRGLLGSCEWPKEYLLDGWGLVVS